MWIQHHNNEIKVPKAEIYDEFSKSIYATFLSGYIDMPKSALIFDFLAIPTNEVSFLVIFGITLKVFVLHPKVGVLIKLGVWIRLALHPTIICSIFELSSPVSKKQPNVYLS